MLVKKQSIPWDLIINYACNNPRYEIVLYCKYYPILGSHNKRDIMNFLDYVTDDIDY